MAADLPPYELTRNPVDQSWGFVCREHGLHRSGLNQSHAINVERKHLREDHRDDDATVNLTMAARAVLDLAERAEDGHTVGPAQRERDGALKVWAALVGPSRDVDYLQTVAAAATPVRAVVVPF